MALTPTFSIDGKVFKAYGSPGVYAAYDANGCSYVGCSKNVMGRACHNSHHRRSVLKRATRVDIYVCRTWADALQLEKRLIKELKPSRNGAPGRRLPENADAIAEFRERWQVGPIDRRRAATEAWQSGVSPATIARTLEISRQRVSQILKDVPRLPFKHEPDARWKYSRARVPHVNL